MKGMALLYLYHKRVTFKYLYLQSIITKGCKEEVDNNQLKIGCSTKILQQNPLKKVDKYGIWKSGW